MRFSPEPILVLSTVMMAITLSIIPMCTALVLLGSVLAVMGFFMGIIDSTANVSMVRLYGQDVSPFLHALHFCYGLGAFVSPMIAKPFLLNMDCSPFINNRSKSHDLLPSNISYYPAQSLEEAQHKTHVSYAFWIMSVLQIPVIILVITLVGKQCYSTRADGQLSGSQFDYSDMDEVVNEAKANHFNKNVGLPLTAGLTALMCFIVCCYDGLQTIHPIHQKLGDATKLSAEEILCRPKANYLQNCNLVFVTKCQALYADYIYSYAVEGASAIDNRDAAYLSACFWVAFFSIKDEMSSGPEEDLFGKAFNTFITSSGRVKLHTFGKEKYSGLIHLILNLFVMFYGTFYGLQHSLWEFCFLIMCSHCRAIRYERHDWPFVADRGISLKFRGFFALGRLISVPIATILTPACMLFINITGCTFALIFMQVGGNNETVIYAGTCMFGLFLSSVFPTAVSWIEQYINANTIITSILVLGAATGEMCFPVIVGQTFETGGPTFFLIFALAMCMCSYCIYIGVCMIGHIILRQTSKFISSIYLYMPPLPLLCGIQSREVCSGRPNFDEPLPPRYAPKHVGVLSICMKKKGGTISEDSGFVANKQFYDPKNGEATLESHGGNGFVASVGDGNALELETNR
ncbi:Major facilitator superfamily domain-containing protein 4A [Nymphon striatum]|nr:Major facilitator superfamily domain-containing protein 4A [Nymphon striatum]